MEFYRGDTFMFDFGATYEDGETYLFKQGDSVKVGIKTRKTNSKCALQKTIEIKEDTDTLTVEFTPEETKKCCEGDKLIEIELTRANGDVFTVYQDKVKVKGDVINE